MLERAVAAVEQALGVQDPERAPAAWASTQNNLGAALQTLGQQKKDAELLQQAVEAYKLALTVWTRQRMPAPRMGHGHG